MSDLRNKTVLLTGASGGIGSPTVETLGEAGANVIAHYHRNMDGARAATQYLPDERKLLLQADFTVPGAARDLWSRALEWRGRIDVLVNNAGINPDTPIDASDTAWDDTWAQVLQVNVIEPASLTREAIRHFQAHSGGTVISLSSWAAQQGSSLPELTAYAASKAAIKAFTQTVARAYASDNVLAYSVAPGIVRTRMSANSAASRGGEEALMAILPLKEMVPPTEVAELITFLASGDCRHLTGATFDLNGASYVR
jgi:NAD(P)-dependent dehydrogenase (short-subunit alcohol dehydrogenase family)